MNWERITSLGGLFFCGVSVPLLILEASAQTEGDSIVELFGGNTGAMLNASRFGFCLGVAMLGVYGVLKLIEYVK